MIKVASQFIGRKINFSTNSAGKIGSPTIYNSQGMEATEMSINRGMDKDVVHICSGILLSHKKRTK